MNATQLLQLWGSAHTAPLDRSALLHQAAIGTTDPAEVLNATPGQCTHALLRWRAALFGEDMACIADCPACSERVEFTLRADDLHKGPYPTGAIDAHVDAAPYHVQLRAPRWRDILASGGDDRALLTSCVVRARSGRKPIGAEALPTHVIDRVEEALQRADPLLGLTIGLDCAACAHAWPAPFDVAAYAWSELDRWAQRMLTTVHRLARAYGWSEHEVLGMSAWRRERYLQLLAS